MKAYANGGWREAATATAFVGGQWRTITRALVYVSGAWKTAVRFIEPMTVTIPAIPDVAVYGLGYATGDAFLNSNVTGGLAPYGYAWTITGYSTPLPPSIGSTAYAGTSLIGSASEGGGSYTVDVRVAVTDAAGQTASAVQTVYFINLYQGGF